MSGEFKIHPSVIEALRVLLYTNAWSEFFVPAIETMKTEWYQRLIDPGQKRNENFPDDYIRGCIATLDVVLHLPDALIAEADRVKEGDEHERRERDAYATRAETGRIGPFYPDDLPTTGNREEQEDV